MKAAIPEMEPELVVRYHEAGHALASCKLGIPFHYVTVVTGKNGSKGHINL
jgi:hypothetical protein